MAAIRLARTLAAEARPATVAEQPVLAAWSSWGALPQIFDEHADGWAAERAELRGLLSEPERDAARRTTINAHYTDPAIASAVWEVLRELGLPTAAEVLEPGCGSGTFLGLAPDGVQVTGVELDPVTAGIAAALYPGAQVRAESFAETRFPEGSFDAAIGNVPFANVSLHDPVHNRNKHSMHNHFLLKSLDLVRPGGMVAVLTSSFTLDAVNPGARREMHAKADLVAAVRLPTGAHRRTAGTEAVTDLLILRRREPGGESGEDSWTRTVPLVVDGQVTDRRINCYLAEHPQMVLGAVSLGQGMYGADTLTVRAEDLAAVPETLRAVLLQVAGAGGEGFRFSERTVVAPRPVARAIEPGAWLGMVTRHPVGGFEVLEATGPVSVEVPRSQQAELAELIGLRDTARQVLDLEAGSIEDTEELSELRAALRGAHEAYLAAYGPINRYTQVRSGRIDPDTGEPVMNRRRPPVMRWLRDDPFAPLLRALELFDEDTQAVAPAAILTERVVVPRVPVLGADNPADAVAIALDTDGHLDLARIADLLGVDEDTARHQLGTLAFTDPVSGDLIPRAEYLSGNVRVKLDAAEAAVAAGQDEFASNTSELRAVLPAALGPAEITPRIGAAWIGPADHQQFLREVLGDRGATVRSPDGVMWEVTANRWSVAATSEWGTERRPAGELIAALLQSSEVRVDDRVEDRLVFNPTETEAAREKASALQDRFADWVWEDPERAARLSDRYNRQFNSLVMRDYTAEGERLSLPGLAASFTPRPHQRAAVARMLAEPSVGLFHQVGAGKTSEMVVGAMELRRLGMASKPVVVVPNHMLEQFSREWLQRYPQARILAAGKDDVTAERRRDLVARIATGDWDGIVITHGAFERIAVSPAAQADYLRRQIAGYRRVLTDGEENGQLSSSLVKRIEKKILTAEERLKATLDVPRDPGVSFEDTGIDYLIVDEGHLFKNLSTESSIPDANIAGSKRAQDLHMKAEILRQTHGERVITMATATPIANSITEAHVMTRYLRPDLLETAGVAHFDRWARTFGETVTELELSPAGSGYRPKTRFARFQNVPELLRIWGTFADVKTAEDLNLPTPELRERPGDGQRRPVTVTVPPTVELTGFVAELGRRAERLSGRSEKGADNLLKIIGEGRHAALDMRLVGGGEPSGPTKVSAAADRIAAIWRENRDREYRDDTGRLSPVRGGFQIVFSDLATPKPDRFNVYSELKFLLVDRGLPARSIQFIQDHNTDVAKARLFEACRSGEVAVLIGSTPTMGVGTNVQARAVALHHLDAPWRPADLDQRDGRILRQGNQNREVEIYRWTTGRSFDTYMWQTLERKQRFIAQVLRGRIDVREIEDIGEVSLSLAETKALAADDPLILEQATVDAQVAKLERLDRAHHKQLSMLSWRAEQASITIRQADADEPALQAAVDRLTPTDGQHFHMIVNGTGYGERTEAHHALGEALFTGTRRVYRATPINVTIHLAGQDLTVHQEPDHTTGHDRFRFAVADTPRTEFVVSAESLAGGIGAIRSIEHHLARLPRMLAQLAELRDEARVVETEAHRNIGRPFKHATDLETARGEQARIRVQLATRAENEPRATTSAPAEPNPRPAPDHERTDDRFGSRQPHPPGLSPHELIAQAIDQLQQLTAHRPQNSEVDVLDSDGPHHHEHQRHHGPRL